MESQNQGRSKSKPSRGWIRRSITVTLVVAIAIALGLLVRQRSILAGVRNEYGPLAKRFGRGEIRDPAIYQITRLATDDPMRFLWRVYLPAGLTTHTSSWLGGSSSTGSSSQSSASHTFVQIRFRVIDEVLYVYSQQQGGSSLLSLGSNGIWPFVLSHWNELSFEMLGEKDQTLEIDIDQPLPYLLIRIPDDLMSELHQEVDEREISQARDGLIYYMVAGTGEAVESFRQSVLEKPR